MRLPVATAVLLAEIRKFCALLLVLGLLNKPRAEWRTIAPDVPLPVRDFNYQGARAHAAREGEGAA